MKPPSVLGPDAPEELRLAAERLGADMKPGDVGLAMLDEFGRVVASFGCSVDAAIDVARQNGERDIAYQLGGAPPAGCAWLLLVLPARVTLHLVCTGKGTR